MTEEIDTTTDNEQREILLAITTVIAHLEVIRAWIVFGGIVLLLSILASCIFVACSGSTVLQYVK